MTLLHTRIRLEAITYGCVGELAALARTRHLYAPMGWAWTASPEGFEEAQTLRSGDGRYLYEPNLHPDAEPSLAGFAITVDASLQGSVLVLEELP